MIPSERTDTAGLVFLGSRPVDLAEMAQHVATAIEAAGARVRAMTISKATEAAVRTCDHDVTLTLLRGEGTMGAGDICDTFIRVAVTAPGSPAEDPDSRGETLLVQVRRALHSVYTADRTGASGASPKGAAHTSDGPPIRETAAEVAVHRPERKWRISHGGHDRPGAQGGSAEKRERLISGVRHEEKWHQAPEDQLVLRNALRAEDDIEAPSEGEVDRVRLSAWFLSIAVAVLCLPLGVALTIINLLRGENLRLASQTAALTGTFLALNASGATAEAAALLRTLVG